MKLASCKSALNPKTFALRWAPNVTGEKMEITFFPDRGSNPVRWPQSPTLYHVAIKAGLYRKAVQVYHIPIPGDRNKTLNLKKWLVSMASCQKCR